MYFIVAKESPIGYSVLAKRNEILSAFPNYDRERYGDLAEAKRQCPKDMLVVRAESTCKSDSQHNPLWRISSAEG